MDEKCEYLDGDICLIATRLADGRRVPVLDPRACVNCMSSENAKQPNHVTASLAISTASRPSEKMRLTKKLKRYAKVVESFGPGTELSKLLRAAGFSPEEGCLCTEHKKEMNDRGWKWCYENADTIAGWLHEEAERRGFSTILAKIGAKPLIYTAVYKSRKAEEKAERLQAGLH